MRARGLRAEMYLFQVGDLITEAGLLFTLAGWGMGGWQVGQFVSLDSGGL